MSVYLQFCTQLMNTSMVEMSCNYLLLIDSAMYVFIKFLSLVINNAARSFCDIILLCLIITHLTLHSQSINLSPLTAKASISKSTVVCTPSNTVGVGVHYHCVLHQSLPSHTSITLGHYRPHPINILYTQSTV